MPHLFRVKFCGITGPCDAQAAVRAGADAIGLNFYPLSPRSIDETTASEIIRGLPSHVATVGVFVNEPLDRVTARADRLGLHYIQLHGDESPEYASRLAPRSVIRAFRISDSFTPLFNYISQCTHIHFALAAVLIDSHQTGTMGGTGRVGDWGEIRKTVKRISETPTILAGGLRPANVAAAIAQVRPAAVDVASGVESAPGRKDPEEMLQFVAAALAAWQRLAATGSDG